MEPILKIENLKTSFMTSGGEVQAVRGVSFSVGKGEIPVSYTHLTLPTILLV